MRSLSSISGFKRLRKGFSKSFDMLGGSNIEVYDVACSGGLYDNVSYRVQKQYHLIDIHFQDFGRIFLLYLAHCVHKYRLSYD